MHSIKLMSFFCTLSKVKSGSGAMGICGIIDIYTMILCQQVFNSRKLRANAMIGYFKVCCCLLRNVIPSYWDDEIIIH